MELIGVPMDTLPEGRYAVLQKIGNKEAHLYGYGVPDGESIPDVECIPCRIEQAGGRVCGRVKLEDGTVVFSAESYIMPEEHFKEIVAKNNLTIVPANLEASRAEGLVKLKADKPLYDLYLGNLEVEKIVKARNDLARAVQKSREAGVPADVKVDPVNLMEGPSTKQ